VNVPGSGISGLDYPVAVKKLMDGYSLKKPDAQAILNDFYAPGEAGRPMSTKQKATNKTAKGAAATIRKAFGGA
jgi:hypothetical protein